MISFLKSGLNKSFFLGVFVCSILCVSNAGAMKGKPGKISNWLKVFKTKVQNFKVTNLGPLQILLNESRKYTIENKDTFGLNKLLFKKKNVKE